MKQLTNMYNNKFSFLKSKKYLAFTGYLALICSISVSSIAWADMGSLKAHNAQEVKGEEKKANSLEPSSNIVAEAGKVKSVKIEKKLGTPEVVNVANNNVSADAEQIPVVKNNWSLSLGWRLPFGNAASPEVKNGKSEEYINLGEGENRLYSKSGLYAAFEYQSSTNSFTVFPNNNIVLGARVSYQQYSSYMAALEGNQVLVKDPVTMDLHFKRLSIAATATNYLDLSHNYEPYMKIAAGLSRTDNKMNASIGNYPFAMEGIAWAPLISAELGVQANIGNSKPYLCIFGENNNITHLTSKLNNLLEARTSARLDYGIILGIKQEF